MTTMTRIKTKESTTTMMAINDDEEADNDEAEIFQNVSLRTTTETKSNLPLQNFTQSKSAVVVERLEF